MTTRSCAAAFRARAVEAPRFDDLGHFFLTNRDDLVDVLQEAGATDLDIAEVDRLVDLLIGDNPDQHAILDSVSSVRDALADVPVSAWSHQHLARPDLDAAVCWFGARLDDFLAELS